MVAGVAASGAGAGRPEVAGSAEWAVGEAVPVGSQRMIQKGVAAAGRLSKPVAGGHQRTLQAGPVVDGNVA
jgi:hypothetical protein